MIFTLFELQEKLKFQRLNTSQEQKPLQNQYWIVVNKPCFIFYIESFTLFIHFIVSLLFGV